MNQSQAASMTSPVPPSDTQVEASVKQLSGMIDRLQESFETLRRRVQPVMRPEPPSESEVKDTAYCCPLASEIEAQTHRIERTTGDISHMLGLLEV